MIKNTTCYCSGLVTTAVPNTEIGEVKKKILDASELATTALFNTKIGEVGNKIPDVSKLVKKADYDYCTSKENISLLLIIISLRVTYLI